MTAAPIGLQLMATYEYQALQRIGAAEPWTVFAQPTRPTDSPSKEQVVKQIAENTAQQAFVVLLTCIGIATSADAEGKFGDFNAFNLAIAHAYVYLIGRVFFALGYLSGNQLNRVYGLCFGGFWLGVAYLLYGVLLLIG